MAKNVIIQEDGSSKVLSGVTKIQTELNDGTKAYWIPEDEVTLGTKTITQDGTYNASDDEVYGYSSVTVEGIGSISMGTRGEKTVDENGTYLASDDEVYGYSTFTVNIESSGETTNVVGTDPDTGETVSYHTGGGGGGGSSFVKETIPSSIEIVTPPTTTTYQDGTTIDFSGISVFAHLNDGEIWTNSRYPTGEVPFGELTFPVKKAVYDPDADSSQQEADTDDPDGNPLNLNTPIPYFTAGTFSVYGIDDVFGPRGGYVAMVYGPSTIYVVYQVIGNFEYTIMFSKMPFTLEEWQCSDVFDINTALRYDKVNISSIYSYTYDNIPFYLTTLNPNVSGINIVDAGSPYDPGSGYTITQSGTRVGIASIVFGYTPGPSGGTAIPVQWKRYNDSKILESSFNITVTPSPNGGNSSGGGGGGGTSYDDTQ